jgi:hypothetical protein
MCPVTSTFNNRALQDSAASVHKRLVTSMVFTVSATTSRPCIRLSSATATGILGRMDLQTTGFQGPPRSSPRGCEWLMCCAKARATVVLPTPGRPENEIKTDTSHPSHRDEKSNSGCPPGAERTCSTLRCPLIGAKRTSRLGARPLKFTCAHFEQSSFVHVGLVSRTGHGMCDKCQELENKIERYRRLASSINDRLTIDQFNKLIKDAEAEKAKLHPDRER